nr:MAG TPA_asm: hypothetical protein [Bacteriophage sp.]
MKLLTPSFLFTHLFNYLVKLYFSANSLSAFSNDLSV